MNRDQKQRYEQLDAEIKESDTCVRNAELAISEYLSVHPNAYRMQSAPQGWVVRLNAITADLQLTALETKRDAAKERFARALSEYAEVEKNLNLGVHYVGGIEQER